jgi:PAS domain S-box-containing protein
VNQSALSQENTITSELDSGISRRLSQFVSACSVLAVGFGLWVLTGWMFHLHRVKSILTGQVEVKANAAICFVFLGIALWSLRREHAPMASGWKLAVRIAAAVAGVVGLLSLLEFLWGWDLGIDQLLFTAGAEDVPGSARPGLMSPIAAWGFFSLAPALLLLDAKRRIGRWAAQLLPCGVAIVSLFGILDLILEPATTHTYISPITASALFVFSFALMFARRQWGLGKLVASATLGGMLTRRLLPAAIVTPLLVGWLRWHGGLAGLFSEWTGLTLMTVFTVVLLAGLTAWTGFVVDRSDSARRQGEETITRLAAIVNSSHDAIIGKTVDGMVTSWNPGAEAIYGYSAQDIVGQSIYLVIPLDRREEFATIMQRIRQGQPVSHYETMRVRQDGQTIHVSLSVSAVKDNAGKIVGVSTIARDITERKRAEERVRRASLYTRSLIEASLDPLVTISRDGKITDVNEATEHATGVARDHLIGSDFSNYFTEPEKARSGYEEVFAKGSVHDYALAIRHASGRVMEVLYNASVFKNEAGQIEGVFAAARDITERNRTERALNRSEMRYRSLVTATAQIVWTTNPQGEVDDMPAWRALTGQSRDEVRGAGWLNAVHPDDRERTATVWAQALRQCTLYDIEYRVRRHDGEYRMLAVRGVPVLENGNTIREWVGACTDVTERRQAEEQLRRASLYSRSLIEASLDPLVTIRKDGKITDVNRATEAATGVSRERLIGSDFSNYFTEPEKARRGYERVFAESAVRDYPLAIRHTSGRITDVLYNAALFKNEAGGIEGVFAAARDITERKRAELALQAERQRFRDVLDRLPAYVVLMTPDYHVPFANHFFRERFGESQGKRCYEYLFGRSEPCEICETYKTLKNNAPQRWKWTGPDSRHYDIYDFPFADTDGSPLILEMGVDITEREQAEEEVRRLNDELEQRVIQRTAQLEAANKELEAFTYSVSHDLRAPLRHISGFSKILTEEYGSTLAPEAHHHLVRIQEGTRRMGLLVDDLLNLGRVGRRELRLQVTGLNSVVNEAMEDLKSECEGRQVEWKVGNLPFVECDPTLMKQVFQNLLSNAVKFTRPRSPAIIEVGQKDQAGTPVVFVSDNGVGFNVKYADKLFGVFQRLHRPEDFEGTGVGLATVQRIVQKHGGRIWVEAELDKGATFYFTLGVPERTELKTKAAMAGDKE